MSKHLNLYNKLFMILLVVFFIYLAFRVYSGFNKITNGYTNIDNKNVILGGLNPSNYPLSVELPLLSDVYKYTGSKNVSNKNYNQIWWEYPIFTEGSYKQITNNLRYYDNPDEGICIRADFCNALYDYKNVKSNYIYPLPPVSAPNTKNGEKARVNFYWSHPDNLLQPKNNVSLQPNYL